MNALSCGNLRSVSISYFDLNKRFLYISQLCRTKTPALEKYTVNSIVHREKGPAVIRKNNYGIFTNWIQRGVLHRTDGPAMVHEDRSGRIIRKGWYIWNSLHREDGPAEILITYNSSDSTALKYKCFRGVNKIIKTWYFNNAMHRDISDGPARTVEGVSMYSNKWEIVERLFYTYGKRIYTLLNQLPGNNTPIKPPPTFVGIGNIIIYTNQEEYDDYGNIIV